MYSKRPWTPTEIQYLRNHYPYDDVCVIAKALRRTPNSVKCFARLHGIKKPCFEWTEERLNTLKEMYPNHLNSDIANEFGCPLHIVWGKARRLKLRKADGFLVSQRERINRKISNGQLNSEKENTGRFKKGVRNSPGTEFVKGHKQSAETIKKRTDAFNETVRMEKLRVAYGRKKKTNLRFI